MIFFGEKGVCIKNIFMDFDRNKANGFYLLFKKKSFGFQKIPWFLWKCIFLLETLLIQKIFFKRKSNVVKENIKENLVFRI